MTQNESILAYLRRGWTITPLEALRMFGCFRLGARIYELRRKGVQIDRELVQTAGGARVARYKLGGVAHG